MGSTTNPTATITNNSGFDVEIYDVFNPSTDPKTQGPLTYKLLATVPNGASAQDVQTIHFASQLQAMLTGKVKALNDIYYQQLPVAVLAVSPFKDSNAFTITSDMQQSMVDSFKFIKYSQANPSSKIATQFRAALADKKSQADAVSKFFKSTNNFKLVTLSTWTAVFNWQAQFTNPWQGTYYLYSLGSKSAGSTSAPALVATLAITASADNDSAVLTMAGTDNENTAVVMAGDGSMQEENQGNGEISVALKPTWLNVSQNKKVDDKTVIKYVIGAAFAGTINGVKVAGNLNQLAIPDPSKKSKSADKKNSANSLTIGNVAALAGIVSGAAMVYFMWKGHQLAKTQRKNDVQKEAKDKPDADARESQVEQDYQDNEVPEVARDAASAEALVPEVQQAYRDVDQAQDVQNMQDAIRQQEQDLEVILEGDAPSQATVDTANDLQSASDDLDLVTDPNTTPEARSAALSKASTTLTNTSTKIEQTLQDEANQLSQEEHDALKDTQDALKEVEEQASAQEDAQKEQDERDNEEVDKEVDQDQFEEPEGREEPPFEPHVE
ncbi:hypothetical protein FHETE_8847 [Fusarium heterosporum]|uniref:Uncharacterized protein n=1 Tax=Fusarium heterosporum TaxID=42747 RepID=A0A8H5SVF3_FUSHE|nr:hypothetical protein FHETE_8847 [Fusarium heterosporum]